MLQEQADPDQLSRSEVLRPRVLDGNFSRPVSNLPGFLAWIPDTMGTVGVLREDLAGSTAPYGSLRFAFAP